MKTQWINAVFEAGVLCASAAQASHEMAKSACGRCHDISARNKGPTYPAMAARSKNDEQAALKAIYDPKAEHPKVKAKEDDVKAIVKWMLTQAK